MLSQAFWSSFYLNCNLYILWYQISHTLQVIVYQPPPLPLTLKGVVANYFKLEVEKTLYTFIKTELSLFT